jgi:ubiquinone biosynthesis accessory factor UbiJ
LRAVIEDNQSSIVLKLLDSAIAKVMALDGSVADRLVDLEGKRVQLSLASPDMSVHVSVKAGQLVLRGASLAPADLTIKTELSHLLALGMAKLSKTPVGLGVGKIHISGDAELARQMQQIADQFDPDWDAPFAAVFGDVLGFQLARGAKNVARYAMRVGTSFANSASEYVQEESKDVIPRAELEQFYDDIDALRDRLARTEARFNDWLAKASV